MTPGPARELSYVVGPALSTTTDTSANVITYSSVPATLPITAKKWKVQLPAAASADDRLTTMFQMGGALHNITLGVLTKGWSVSTGGPTTGNVGSMGDDEVVLSNLPVGGASTITWVNASHRLSGFALQSGVFRIQTTPLKPGVFQLQSAETIGSSNDVGAVTGGFTGSFDPTRGVVVWYTGINVEPVVASSLTYNAVGLSYLPLDSALLGLDTTRLPLDGKVPVYRVGDLCVVHNTLTAQIINPLVKGTAYSLGRERLASVRVKDALGVVVPDTLYTALLDPGTLTVPTGSVITSYTQPFTVEHRIEDLLLCSQVDINGKLTFTRSLTHSFPANTSYVSSALPFGDLFARAYSIKEQSTWTGVWSDLLIGSVIIPQFNSALYPIVVTNAGAIKERWVMLFTNSTTYRVIGESVGEIGSGVISSNQAPINPATGVPYFTLPALGWGAGWATGNCLRFNTDACGAPFWAVRTVLQGPASFDLDSFSIAFRGDVDRP